MNDPSSDPNAAYLPSEKWNSVGYALSALFPDGTAPNDPGWMIMPWAPTDVFAAAAYLLDRGGVYHRLVPAAATLLSSSRGSSGPPFHWSDLNLVLPIEDVLAWQLLGQRWWAASMEVGSHPEPSEMQSDPKSVSAVEQLREIICQVQLVWSQLVTLHREKIVLRPPRLLRWWKPAIALLIISDEACKALGHQIGSNGTYHPLEDLIRRSINAADDFERLTFLHSRHRVYAKKTDSFTFYTDKTVVRVTPKSRTPSVGCTMRTLSHHLAIVPPQGVVDINWYRARGNILAPSNQLNILAVPFPFQIQANCFSQVAEVSIKPPAPAKPWGWFHVDQRWLERTGMRPQEGSLNSDGSRENIRDFLISLIKRCASEHGRVHGILLPELALDWFTYSLVVSSICDGALGPLEFLPEFLIAGSATDPNGDSGNFVITSTFSLTPDGLIEAHTFCRAKHHRWQLTGSQIADYGLASALDPTRVWWEGNEIPRREIGLTVFRPNSMFTAMICEDLARSEPVHEPLRAVGPNIVFVLLMDGPQLPHRWSGRYATALADDPGSSVLTLTSLGLINRGNASGRRALSDLVGLWKDDTGNMVQISCPPNFHGVLITLCGEPAIEATLDGRTTGDALMWRYSGHQPVKLHRRVPDFDWIFPDK